MASSAASSDTAVRFNPAAFTRAASSRHPAESRWSIFADVYQTLLGAMVLLAYAGSLLYAVREELLVNAASVLTRSVVPEQLAQVPAETALGVFLLLAAAAGFLVLLRLGPVAASAAQGFWWLSLPADRRQALAGTAARKMLKCAVVAGLGFLPVAALAGPSDGLASVLLGAAVAAASGALAFLFAGVVQAAGLKLAASRISMAVVAAGLVLPLLPLLTTGVPVNVPGKVLLLFPSGWPLAASQGAVWPLPVALAAVLAGLCTVYVQLPSLGVSEVTGSGNVSGHAAGALYFGDFRELGEALHTPENTRRFPRLAERPSSAFGILVRADAVAFLRSPGKVLILTVLTLIPAALAVVTGLGSAVVVAGLLLITGWTAASASAGVARFHAGSPVLESLLPLTPVQTRQAHAVVPAVCLTSWSLVTFGMLSLMGAGGPALLLMGVLAGPGLAGAALRGAFRPAPDWTAPGMSRFSPLMPAGIATSFTRGPDIALVAMLPGLIAVVGGGTPWWLVLLQSISSVFCLWLGTRAD